MNLNGPVRHAPDHLAGKVLGLGCEPGDRVARRCLSCRIPHEGPGGIVFGAAVGQHRLNQLEVADGLAELPARERMTHRLGYQPVGESAACRRQVEPAAVQHLHGGPEAPALHTADQRIGGNAAVLEDDVTHVPALLAHLVVGLAQMDAFRRGLDDERGNASRRRCCSGSVRAITVKVSATGAFVMNRLMPLRT